MLLHEEEDEKDEESVKIIYYLYFIPRAVPRSLEVGGQDIGNGEKKCVKRAN